MSRAGTIRLYCYMSVDEKQKIANIAESLNISISQYMRICALHQKLPNPYRNQAILALSKINADIARLGNLQRAVIDKNQQLPSDVIQQIRELSGLLHDKLREF